MSGFWRPSEGGVIVACRLTPKGGRDFIEGAAMLGDGSSVLRVRVRAAPEDGLANRALCALLAKALGVPASAATLVSGGKSRLKQIAVAGDPAALAARLAALGGQ